MALSWVAPIFMRRCKLWIPHLLPSTTETINLFALCSFEKLFWHFNRKPIRELYKVNHRTNGRPELFFLVPCFNRSYSDDYGKGTRIEFAFSFSFDLYRLPPSIFSHQISMAITDAILCVPSS